MLTERSDAVRKGVEEAENAVSSLLEDKASKVRCLWRLYGDLKIFYAGGRVEKQEGRVIQSSKEG